MTAPAPAARRAGSATASFAARLLSGSPAAPARTPLARSPGTSAAPAGAVGNALTTLADRGEADREPGKPIRYQANTATAAAAAAITPRAPAPPKAAPAPAPAPAAAPKPAAPAAPPAAPGPVTRPSGQVYQPRALADMPDVEALRKLRAEGDSVRDAKKMTVDGHPALRDLAEAIVASGGLGCEQETLYDMVPPALARELAKLE